MRKEEAKEWLRKYLADGEASAKQVYKDGETEGFNERTIRRAADELGIKRGEKLGYGKSILWRLPRRQSGHPA